MRTIDEIIIHCAATPRSWRAGQAVEAKRDEIKRWHTDERGWRDIGYHAVIDRDGSIASGRPYHEPGAHVRGRNATTLGVCLLGGKDSRADDRFDEHFTPAQDRALRQWIADRRREFPTIQRVTGHNQFAAKACPGFSVPEWLGVPAPAQPEPAEQPVGLWAALVAVLRGILDRIKGGKA